MSPSASVYGLSPALLKREREAAHLSQAALARRAGYTQGHLSGVEASKLPGSHRFWRDVSRVLDEARANRAANKQSTQTNHRTTATGAGAQ